MISLIEGYKYVNYKLIIVIGKSKYYFESFYTILSLNNMKMLCFQNEKSFYHTFSFLNKKTYKERIFTCDVIFIYISQYLR